MHLHAERDGGVIADQHQHRGADCRHDHPEREQVLADANARTKKILVLTKGVTTVVPRGGVIVDNLDPTTGRFLSPHELRASYERRGVRAGDETIVYCGSGLTAALDLLAIRIAGLSHEGSVTTPSSSLPSNRPAIMPPSAPRPMISW